MSLTGSLPTSTTVSVPPSRPVSALIGSPPATSDDFYIVKYLLQSFGLKTDPSLGAFIPPKRPENYVFESRGSGMIASMSVAIATMIIITSLRLGIRVSNRILKLGLDDLFIVPGALLAIAWPVVQICMVKYGGAGKHIYDVTYEELSMFRTLGYTGKLIFFMAVSFIKISICFFNRRLTSLTSRTWSIFNNVFLFLLVVYIGVALFWNIFQCDPPYAAWDLVRTAKSRNEFHCKSELVVGTALSTIHVVMDFILLAVPLIVLWKVKMDLGTRIRLYFVFSIGSMSAIGALMRQITMGQLTSDISYTFKPFQDWILVDLTFGVVAASLPVLSVLLPKRWKSTVGGATLPTYRHIPTPDNPATQWESMAKDKLSTSKGNGERRAEVGTIRTDVHELDVSQRRVDDKRATEQINSIPITGDIIENNQEHALEWIAPNTRKRS